MSEDEDTDNEKLIILTDGDIYQIGNLMDNIKKKMPVFLDTACCKKTDEYEYIFGRIKAFLEEKRKRILIIKFSGNDDTLKRIGDNFSELIVGISFHKESIFYTKKPLETFLEMINIFDKEK